MQNNITPIIVNKEGVSDATYKVVELYSKSGSWVQEGDLILCFETSKTAIDIESPKDGHIFFNTIENDEISIGQVVAVISDDENFASKDWFGNLNEEKKEISKTSKSSEIKISNSAQELIDKNNINLNVFEDYMMLTKQDVENYLLSTSVKNSIDNLKIDKNHIVIFGGGGHAKMCIELINQTKKYTILGIVDDNLALKTEVLGVPVIGTIASIDKLKDNGLQNIILGVGGVLTKELRKKIFTILKEKELSVPNIIHPSASVEASVIMGEGCQIMQGAIIGSNVKLGNNCIINSGSIISHDTVIEDNVHIAPGAIIGGGVTVKANTIIGMGCTVFLGLTIGKNVVIQNGINVFTNIKNNSHIQKDVIQ